MARPLKGGHKNALAKPPWATQEIGFSSGDHVVHQSCLVYVDESALTQKLEVLYSNGIFHNEANGDDLRRYKLFVGCW